MKWEVEYTDEFGNGWATLTEPEQESVKATVELLGEFGPNLRYPHSSGIAASKHDHLRELREIIYSQLKPERPAEASVPAGFEALPGESLTYTLELAGAAVIADLLTMTPHLYRASAEGRAKAAALTALSLTVDVRLTRFRREAS